MTKITKWWQRMSFWNKLKLTIGGLGVGSELALIIGDSAHEWKVWAAVATIISVVITIWFEDKDNDGNVDILQNKPSL